MIGQTVGHYRIAEELGEGGLGELYLADDSELDRKVALKVLPESTADDEENLRRFRREGKNLSDYVPRGGLSLEKSFEISIPLADALAPVPDMLGRAPARPGNAGADRIDEPA